ncbi:MAG: diguanylate cyclase [bacterium]|nr:diguanylate cyclase [bacterium]MDT8396803.1 diguanylate cyclase [bacterium]
MGYETFVRDRNGRDLPIRISCTLLLEDGEESGVIGFFQDITDMRKMEDELRNLAIILPDTSANCALVPAERLRTRFEAVPFLPAGSETAVSVTVSIGIAEFIPERSLDHLIRLADAAMYKAKQNGRNRTVISEE